MADESPPVEKKRTEQSREPEESRIKFPLDGPILADTSSSSAALPTPDEARSITTQDPDISEVFLYGQIKRTTVHGGPLPDPETLRAYAEIYPNSPKILFDEFRAQSAHRRQLEAKAMDNHILLARRGQVIGGVLAGIGLLGANVAAGLGHALAGFGLAIGSLVPLVSIFVYSQERHRIELRKKEVLKRRVSERQPVEAMEETGL